MSIAIFVLYVFIAIIELTVVGLSYKMLKEMRKMKKDIKLLKEKQGIPIDETEN